MAAVDEALARARARIAPRLSVAELPMAVAAGALVVDIRPSEQREQGGRLNGAVLIDRNVLEWRLDPTCPHRLPDAGASDRHVVIVCNEGYASSFAAAGLRDLGLTNVTDLIGGFQAYKSHLARSGAGEAQD